MTGKTLSPNCTCGKCLASIIDNHGNIDYGYEWNAKLETYTPRDCPEADARRIALIRVAGV